MSIQFSVIIPVYNGGHLLRKALDSVAKQHYPHWEIVVVDDGSEDDSAAVIGAWQGENPAASLQLIQQENRGLGAARNRAIAAARGSYCALLDADDYWAPEKLERCAQFLAASPETVLLYHPVWAIGLGAKKRERRAYPVSDAAELLEKGNPIVPSATVLAREWAQAHPFSTEPAVHGAEDLLLWLEACHQKAKIHFWPEPLSYYREDGGMSSQVEEHIRHVQAALETAQERGWIRRSTQERALQRKYYELGRYYHKRGQSVAANRYYSYADAKSLKLIGFRFLNFLGWKI